MYIITFLFGNVVLFSFPKNTSIADSPNDKPGDAHNNQELRSQNFESITIQIGSASFRVVHSLVTWSAFVTDETAIAVFCHKYFILNFG